MLIWDADEHEVDRFSLFETLVFVFDTFSLTIGVQR